MPATKAQTKRAAARPRVKLWLELNDTSMFCGGLAKMLRAVDETGSIKHAARSIGRSYRFVWSRIKEAEEALGQTLVETRIGGRDTHRSELTGLARDLLDDFDELRRAVHHLVDDVFATQIADTVSRHQNQNAGR